MTTEDQPTRAGIEDKWNAIIEGLMTREEVHAWAERQMFRDTPFDDMMVGSALQYLHGFDLCESKSGDTWLLGHGPPGRIHPVNRLCRSGVGAMAGTLRRARRWSGRTVPARP